TVASWTPRGSPRLRQGAAAGICVPTVSGSGTIEVARACSSSRLTARTPTTIHLHPRPAPMPRAPFFARLLRMLAVCVLAGGIVAVRAAIAEPTLVVKWNDVLLECVRRSKIGPPMVARAIGVTHTCGYDAWAMYDDVAVPTQLRAERRPVDERTDANRQEAFSF